MADKRDYNVFFDTHTVSGIVISTGLYMIFLAGAFALFMENINHWEANEPVRDAAAYIDYDGVLEHLEIMGYDMHGRTVRIRNDQGKIQVFSLPLTNKSLHSNPSAILSDSLAKGSIRLHLESQTFAEVKMIPVDRFKKLGGFLYGLHYFHPIPYGMELSGIVAAIFLFSIITGLIIHWKKIVSNFFTFRLKSTIKNLWADAHSALGIIGLPYQFMFALTGAFLGFHLIFLNPVATMYYGNSIHEVYKDVFPSFSNNKDFAPHGHSDEHVSVNSLVNNTLVEIGDRDISYMDVVVKNYKDENAHLGILYTLENNDGLLSNGEKGYRLTDGKKVFENEVGRTQTLLFGAILTIAKLHYASYGGYFVKIIYFLLALLTCFVIISGVMVWLKAREKNRIYASRRKFNANVGAIYLGICLGLYPAIALMFILTKTFPMEMRHRFDWISWLFLAFWVAYTIYAYFSKNHFHINRNALILAGGMGILVPVLNGFHSGLWFWKSLQMGYPDSFFVDVGWIVLGTATLISAYYAKPLNEKARKAKKGIPIMPEVETIK